jgi:3'-phosphoadenosine 5'-phosphosulfate sulfotransferase (PAPS reductase)/FAD synthetase
MPTKNDLKMLQALPLDIKVEKTKQRIREWVQHWGVDGVYISFSGGKDSTVLLHIVRELYPEIPAVYADTGLEYPEIREFVKSFNYVTILRPKMSFYEVVKKYGYPVVGKEIAECIYNSRKCIESGYKKYLYNYNQIMGKKLTKSGEKSAYNYDIWKPLINVPFKISHMCCNLMKKEPIKKYESNNAKVGITGQLAEESRLRLTKWLQKGCNAFTAKNPVSNPLSFWNNQDILHYIKDNSLEICSVYGNIIDSLTVKTGQECIEGCEGLLRCSGCDRTGCMFCLFGMHLEKGETRLQRLHKTHPKIYDYVLGGGEFENGLWVPNKKGLGMKFVMDEINRVMGKKLYRY